MGFHVYSVNQSWHKRIEQGFNQQQRGIYYDLFGFHGHQCKKLWLVGGLVAMNFIFSHSYWVAFIIPIDFHSYIFQDGVAKNPPTRWESHGNIMGSSNTEWCHIAFATGWWIVAMTWVYVRYDISPK